MKPNLALFAACSVAIAPIAFSQQGAPPDPQMKAVLDAHASLNPKPIETLSPEEARKQPGIDQGFAKVMKEQGKSAEIHVTLSSQ